MATFGVAGLARRPSSGRLLIVTELGLAAGVIAGSTSAALLAAALMALFAATMVGAILRGARPAPCACFGARSTVGWAAVGRNAILAVAFAALPLLPEGDLSTDEWLGLGLGLALLVCAGLAVAVLALAREVGMLRLRLGPEAALEIPGGGPGARLAQRGDLALRPGARGRARARGVHVRGLSRLPGARADDRDARERAVDRRQDVRGGRRAGVWTELGIPGSPFAVAFDLEGWCWRREPSTTSPSSRACSPPPSVAGPSATSPERWVSEPSRVSRALESLAADTSRRGFLARVGGAVTAIAAGGVVARAVKPGEADAFHFCGHIYTTGSCPHPTGMPRIDGHGYPLRASDGEPVDNLGRRVNRRGEPVNEHGDVLRDPDGRPLPPAPRTQGLRRDRAPLRLSDHRRRRLVPLLRRAGAKARRLLRAP